MPVSDFNALKMGQETVNLIDTSETVSEFWKFNADIVAILLFGAIFLAIFLFLIYFLSTKIKKILHK